MKKLLILILFFNLIKGNAYSIEPDVFVQSTVNRASAILSKNILKEEKINHIHSFSMARNTSTYLFIVWICPSSP